MTDHLRFITALFCLKEWQTATNIPLHVRVDKRTGEIKSRRRKDSITIIHEGVFEGFKLIVFEVQHLLNGEYTHSTYHLRVSGSIHKNAFNGRNYERLYFDHYEKELLRVFHALAVEPAQATVMSFEYGVNLKTNDVQDIVENRVVTFSTKEFISYQPGKSGSSLGKFAKRGEYSVKFYNKGPQYGLIESLLRFELRFSKMRRLKKNPYNIVTVADLLDRNKLREVSNLLLKAWEKVLLCNPDLPSDKTPEAYRDLLLSGQNPRYWINLLRNDVSGRRAYYKMRAAFVKLTKKYSESDLHSEIMDLIRKEVNELLG